MSRAYRIFVVDDDEAVRDSLCALLEAFGFAVEDFASSQAFVVAYDGQHRGCLLVDLHMPQSGGLELLQGMPSLGIDLPVVAMTGSLDAKTKALLLEAGAVAVLEKPFDGETLVALLRSALAAPGT